MIPGVSCIPLHDAYASTKLTQIVGIETEPFFLFLFLSFNLGRVRFDAMLVPQSWRPNALQILHRALTAYPFSSIASAVMAEFGGRTPKSEKLEREARCLYSGEETTEGSTLSSDKTAPPLVSYIPTSFKPAHLAEQC